MPITLTEIIRDKIKKEGPLSFHDYMEMALYYPELGYYNSSKEKTGTGGDYYTSPCVTPVFAALIVKQFEEMWQLLGKKTFQIIEYGAGNGMLCSEILACLKRNEEFFEKTSYVVIEKSATMIQLEKAILKDKVKWLNSISELKDVSGCIFSNEVLDNFSVHRVVMKKELMEIFVDYKDGFLEMLKPASEELKNYFHELKIKLPQNFCTEVNLETIVWLREISSALQRGFLMTVDYGFPSANYFHSDRKNGTLLCYHNHKINRNFYSEIGNQDITSHVNFSALRHWGIKNGLDCCGFTSQLHFLSSLGIVDCIKNIEAKSKTGFNEKLFFSNIFYLNMGSKLKVLIQKKGSSDTMLSGLRLPQQL